MKSRSLVKFAKVEVIPRPQMPWKCVNCKALFEHPMHLGPPRKGCPKCGSRQIFDVNLTAKTKHPGPWERSFEARSVNE